MRKVKIVATVGPVSNSFEMLESLFLAGVNVFRLNFSHSTSEQHQDVYYNIRAISQKHSSPIGILADLQGPKLRVGKFINGSEKLVKGQSFVFDLDDTPGDNLRVNLPHQQIFDAVTEGDNLLIDDGRIKVQVKRCTKDVIETEVIVGGTVSNFKGVNFPSGVLKISSLTEKDLKDLQFALSLGVDYVALSFVQLASDIETAKDIIKGKAKIIAKIEKPSAVEHIEEIIKVSDGIMVARGDLGVEMPVEKVPRIQKNIIKLCRKHSKPVIVATQMLDSMTYAPVPTRAEASDVANAVYDGADAVMLSGETTVGEYPLEVVTTMSNIIECVESDDFYWQKFNVDYNELMKINNSQDMTIGRSVSNAAKMMSDQLGVRVIVAFSFGGTTAARISQKRPESNILVITSNNSLYNQLTLFWGIRVVLVNELTSLTDIIDHGMYWLKEAGWVKVKDKIIVVGGVPLSIGGITNTIRVVEIED